MQDQYSCKININIMCTCLESVGHLSLFSLSLSLALSLACVTVILGINLNLSVLIAVCDTLIVLQACDLNFITIL